MTDAALALRETDRRGSIHALSTPEVFRALATQSEGLTQAEAAARLQRFGPNALREVRGKSLFLKFLANFTHLMTILLWVGGVVGFIAHMPQLGFAIWMVNVINGAFSFWQEYRAEKAAEALRKLLPHYVRVIRQGEEQRLLAEALAPGDLMLLAEGDRISADGRLVESVLIYAPSFQGVFDTAAFPLRNWLFLFAWTPSLLVADELRKAWLRWREIRKG